ncbi:hypothetical protein FF38_11948 [Lucilia cuprina]|uniref:Uncharacterized protein n=1 Tax=Lucilia cuprina TaxID=7375 RepID=A0A0L0C5F3_LUCCU|nr:hypothetical protein CVS40_11977 [Lucilia cuprina]KNC27466.1 hypothetical protein FF38_11948 [Lucilia cuprina]
MPPKANPESFAAQLRKGIEEINENIDKKLEAHCKSTEDRIYQAAKDLEIKFGELVSKIKEDFVAEMNKVKSDINHCYEFVKQIDKSSTSRFMELEKSQNLLMKRFNRPDIIVSGLPAASPNLKIMILSLAKVYAIPFSENDIQYTPIKNNSEVLIKFNSISTRDSLMKKYYSTRNLMLKDLLQQGENEEGADLEERVYLNDHLTLMANKLCYLCRRLKRNKQISGFRFRNGDVLRAVIKTNDGSEETLDIFNITEKFQNFLKI